MSLVTAHKLDFEVAPWEFDDDWLRFRIGTCSGLWKATIEAYEILAIDNDEPGNGHFEDVLEWFEASCKRDKKKLQILEVWNEKFRHHLINKRGFLKISEEDVEKSFED